MNRNPSLSGEASARLLVEELAATVRARMEQTASSLGVVGMPAPALLGKLLRPLVSCAGSTAEEREGDGDPRFWSGTLAIQMVHEASLLHDDIVDEADERRGTPSLAARAGVAPALIAGDHLLTAAYRIALQAGSSEFLALFIGAVERTVAGERQQGKRSGDWLDESEYREIVGLKSGELFGCALALRPALQGDAARAERAYGLGRRIGTLYQMVDDFLDYCPHAGVGKPPLQDYRHGKWTFPLLYSNVDSFDFLPATVPELLFTARLGHRSAMRLAFQALLDETSSVQNALAFHLPEDDILPSVFGSWLALAEDALVREERFYRDRELGSGFLGAASHESATAAPPRPLPGSETATAPPRTRPRVAEEARALGGFAEQAAHFRKHSKSFRFGARLFPPDARRVVGGMYAFCRFTDDLVDEGAHGTPAEGHARLDEWLALTRRAYSGETTDIPFLDEVMGLTAERGVPFRYAEALIDAVRMDLEPVRFESMAALRVYTHGVASVVGQWMTELFGSPSPWTLERAGEMGHAMQLTNIVRDVGEDWRMGRVYLPLDRMSAAGISPDVLGRMAEGDEATLAAHRDGYRQLMEEIMGAAEASYDAAFAAIPSLPPFFQRPVAVAASVYRGIHAEVRRNGYDNLGRRAYTTLPRKVVLAGSGFLELSRARRRVRAGGRRASEALETGREVGA